MFLAKEADNELFLRISSIQNFNFHINGATYLKPELLTMVETAGECICTRNFVKLLKLLVYVTHNVMKQHQADWYV